MQEVDQKSKHKCKFCSKIFPCGRSLGGHMRSHLINVSSTEKKLPPLPPEDGPTERRKSDHDKLCKECGKAFQSWKALFGHMKCHSTAGLNDDDTWQTSSEEALCRRKRSHRAKRYTDSSPDLSPSDQEEVALSLILLSMDCMDSSLHSHNTSFESNNKAREGEERESRAPRKRSKTNQNLETDSEVNSPKTVIKKMGPFLNKNKNKNKNKWSGSNESECKFRCMICNKGFPSYQALGGHRASHKKFKGCCAPTTTTTTPPSQKLAQELEECKKSKDHECPVCFKIFPSGQALGGHKRSHLISDHQAKTEDLRVERRVPQVRDFLDLNLPAPLEEDCVELKPWWIGATHEPLLGLLSSS